MYVCRYCNKECKNKISLVQHEIRCKQNPDKIKINSGFTEYNKQVKSGERKPTNQFIKARELGLPIPERTKETRDKIAKYQLGKRHPEEIRLKIQSTVLRKIEDDEWHNSFGVKHYYGDDGISLDSSWEVKFVEYLDSLGITWKRNKIHTTYFWKDSDHKYFPDFYLPDYDVYIEIKGLPTERDYAKWSQFPYKIDIYDSKDLYELGLLTKYDDRSLVNEKFRKKNISLKMLMP